MIKIKILLILLTTSLLLQSCSKILEPVILVTDKKVNLQKAQEEFDIKIKPLTFSVSQNANQDPFPRLLMLKGSGSRANVFNESDFLTAVIPNYLKTDEYKVGYGDELSFNILNEYLNEKLEWPTPLLPEEYLLGVGDKLRFVQLSDLVSGNEFENDLDIRKFKKEEENINTTGIIGNDGNILLLGVGNLQVVNKSLNSVRTEVRNILIRNGRSPNFQLEISSFQSKKAYSNIINKRGDTVDIIEAKDISNIIPINNIPISLQEVALNATLSVSDENFSIITLTRNKKNYRYTAGQLFNINSPEIFIKDNDQIRIDINKKRFENINAKVGSKGNILLPGVGRIRVINRSLNDIYDEIHSILIKKGMKPNFQLELIGFKSKKVYLVIKGKSKSNNGEGNFLPSSNSVIPLSNIKTSLKDIILQSKKFNISENGLTLVTLKRNKKIYRLPLDKIFDAKTPNIWLQDNDQIEIENLSYKPGQVFAFSGAGKASIVSISASKRESLANILFTDQGAFSNLYAKRSEIYLLRGRKPVTAYHLDAQNVSRVLIAAKTELRPNDIIYVADRPIISFNRLLSEISPLRNIIKNISDDNFTN